ncbi:MAG: tetratricopeptide repeat protein [Melioribacteraceae bacterium]|nr:tetratricopeptide repeat protein [Melioribacteraceae bacterium]
MATGLVFYLFEALGVKDTFHLANCFFYRGHLKSALRNYGKGANNGDPKSMYALAIFYENGIAVSEDHSKYFYWMKKSAQLGHQGAIGECYIDGNGYEKNTLQGFSILKDYAINCKESFVQGSVGGYYLGGEIVPQNIGEAKKWFKLSADNYNPISKEILKTL